MRLFDGKDLDGWDQVGGSNWHVADGAIVADTMADKKEAGYLVTKKSYKNFIVRVEFMPSDDANSGLYFRCLDAKKITDRTCYEANIFEAVVQKTPPIRGRSHACRKSPQPSECVVGPGGVPPHYDSNDLFCPAYTNAGFETKRQFPQLSSLRSPHSLVAASNAERERLARTSLRPSTISTGTTLRRSSNAPFRLSSYARGNVTRRATEKRCGPDGDTRTAS